MELTNILVATTFGCENIPTDIANLIKVVISAIKIVVPIILIIWGMLDLGKAVMAQKEDEIKKGQQTFLKRVIAAIIVFFVPSIVSMLLKLLGQNECSNLFT